MSYEKAMKRNNRRNKAIQPSGFSPLAPNERRSSPWLGSEWFTEGMDEKREQFIAEYEKETERLLAANPNLKIVE